MAWQTIATPLFAFLLGSIPFGLLIAKSQGINIRDHGSGNIGATNVLRVIGKKYGISCFFLDFIKGLAPTIIAMNLLRFAGHEAWYHFSFSKDLSVELPQLTAQSLQVATGLCTILGHNYSPWVGFKGGKGIATSAGVIVVLAPFGLPILGAVWFILFKLTRYVSVASIGAAIALPLIVVFGSWYHGKLANDTWNKPLMVFAIFVAVMATWKHRSNIKKLLNGTENKFTKKK